MKETGKRQGDRQTDGRRERDRREREGDRQTHRDVITVVAGGHALQPTAA